MTGRHERLQDSVTVVEVAVVVVGGNVVFVVVDVVEDDVVEASVLVDVVDGTVEVVLVLAVLVDVVESVGQGVTGGSVGLS